MKGERKIVHWITAVVLAAVVTVMGAWSSRHVADPVCAQVQITIKDSTERQYVDANELQQQLNAAGLWPMGHPMSRISCHQIEQHTLTHPMLRRAECYKTANGVLHIDVHQRQPLMLVQGDEQYYIDSDRKMMPLRASVTTPVVVVRGRIGKQQATGEMFDFVRWLDSSYWKNIIHTIHVITPQMIQLQDEVHGYTILIGSVSGARERMDELEKLYEKGFTPMGYPKYKQIDLQYNGQIIGRK